MEPFIGQILLVAFNFEPPGWAFCNGQTLPIAQNQALFSLLGTQYGGNGVSTFGLPDLRGRVAIGSTTSAGPRPGNLYHPMAESGGTETSTLLHTNLPFSNVSVATVPNGTSGAVQAATPSTVAAPFNNMPPYLSLNYIIALQGIYPSRQ